MVDDEYAFFDSAALSEGNNQWAGVSHWKTLRMQIEHSHAGPTKSTANANANAAGSAAGAHDEAEVCEAL